MVILRSFKTADRGNSGKLNKSSFRKLFEYLIFFNNVAHLFDRIDDSGDGVLSLAEFKIGAHLYAISQLLSGVLCSCCNSVISDFVLSYKHCLKSQSECWNDRCLGVLCELFSGLNRTFPRAR